jgi:hypothetical protein
MKLYAAPITLEASTSAWVLTASPSLSKVLPLLCSALGRSHYCAPLAVALALEMLVGRVLDPSKGGGNPPSPRLVGSGTQIVSCRC